MNTLVQSLRQEGRITIMEGHGKIIDLVVPEKWKADADSPEGIFLIFEIFQFRSFAQPFSEVSLDIVELASKPIIYHTPANGSVSNAPIVNGLVKFAFIQEGFWNRFLFNFGRPLIYQASELLETENNTAEKFPLAAEDVKEMFLGPQGEVKILK
jgi:hypothetical protein